MLWPLSLNPCSEPPSTRPGRGIPPGLVQNMFGTLHYTFSEDQSSLPNWFFKSSEPLFQTPCTRPSPWTLALNPKHKAWKKIPAGCRWVPNNSQSPPRRDLKKVDSKWRALEHRKPKRSCDISIKTSHCLAWTHHMCAVYSLVENMIDSFTRSVIRNTNV